MSPEETWAELYKVAQYAGHIIAGKYSGVVDAEDMTQEGMLWLLEHPRRVEHYRLPDGTLHVRQLASEVITRHLAGVAHRERAEVLGVADEDRYAYSIKMVEVVLPHIFESVVPKSVEYGQGRGSTDPAERGNFQALVMDVRAAFDAVCSAEDRRILFTRAVGGWTWDRFGEVYERSGEYHRLRYHDALRRMAEYLSNGVVVESDPEADALLASLHAEPVAPALSGDEEEDDWRTAGRDPYKEPDW